LPDIAEGTSALQARILTCFTHIVFAVCFMVTSVSKLRKKWLFQRAEPPPDAVPSVRPFDPFTFVPPSTPHSGHTVEMRDGVLRVFAQQDAAKEVPLYVPGNVSEYYEDLRAIMRVVENGPSKTFCFRRLMLLEVFINQSMNR
jgi:hypothetical protein